LNCSSALTSDTPIVVGSSVVSLSAKRFSKDNTLNSFSVSKANNSGCSILFIVYSFSENTNSIFTSWIPLNANNSFLSQTLGTVLKYASRAAKSIFGFLGTGNNALREALLNTVVHRDYDYSGSILISIFTDRIEFVSLGGLVKGITLTDIMRGISQSRNTIIAGIFYRLELIESYGTGIQRILESYELTSLKATFEVAAASFVVILPNMSVYKNDLTDESLPDDEKVLQLLDAKGKITRKDIEVLFKCSSFPANNVIKKLLDKGKIVRIGAARATKYIKAY